MFNKILPMTGVELQTSGIKRDRSTNWATTTSLMAFTRVINVHGPSSQPNSLQIFNIQPYDHNRKKPGLRQGLNLLCPRSLGWMLGEILVSHCTWTPHGAIICHSYFSKVISMWTRVSWLIVRKHSEILSKQISSTTAAAAVIISSSRLITFEIRLNLTNDDVSMDHPKGINPLRFKVLNERRNVVATNMQRTNDTSYNDVGRAGDGQVVSMLAFYYDYTSLSPDVFLKLLFVKRRRLNDV